MSTANMRAFIEKMRVDDGRVTTVCGININELSREELLVVLARAVRDQSQEAERHLKDLSLTRLLNKPSLPVSRLA